MRSRVAAAAVAVLATVGAASTADAEPTPMREVEGVPVLARTLVASSIQNAPPPAVLSVHGVRRVEGAAVVYFSMGIPESSQAPARSNFSTYGTGFFNVLSQNPGVTTFQCSVAALDIAGGRAFTALRVQGGQRCIGTRTGEFATTSETGPNAALVGHTVIAPIPPELTEVDLYVGSQVLHDVPVEDGVMEPLHEGSGPVVVGTGWPEVDLSQVATAVTPAEAVRPLRTMVTDLKAQVSQTQKSVEIDASVLFAVDKSALTPRASAIIAQAVARIKAAAPKGTVVVEGHTDSNASDAYNLKLSQARAAAVAAALRPQLPGYTIQAVGKGETSPIAPNTTAEGRALNRRVSISLPK
ncbi:OmpA family protein [Knoellia sp. CPCC 206450]|uniref:OmpA family protein n=1 Tax=Knoellia tibetensis TaxID=3404798 RepID=UPI003B43C998